MGGRERKSLMRKFLIVTAFAMSSVCLQWQSAAVSLQFKAAQVMSRL